MRRSRSPRDEYKTQQLCRQVERRLSLVFSGELRDHLLEGLLVVDVTAIDGTALLRVEVALPPGSEAVDPVTLLERLGAATPWLRSEIAQAITRKKTPQLSFALADLSIDDEEDEDVSRTGDDDEP